MSMPTYTEKNFYRASGKRFALSCVAMLMLGLGSSTCTAGGNSPQTTAPVVTASFDCSKAVSVMEKLICRDVQTSALDGKMQQTYKTALAAVVPYSKSDLVEEQRHWITYTRNICQNTACLRQVYIARIAMLARNEKIIANECVNVVTYRDPSIRIASFNQSLAEQKQSGKIIGCSRLLDLPAGTAQGNHSFGGICILQDGTQRKDVEICNDDMIGHFHMQSGTQSDTDKNLVDFIYNNCSGS
jgi:uncharacterized protein